MARFNRSVWSAIGVAEPHDVVADVGGEVVGILHRQGEDIAFGGDVGAYRALHLGELFQLPSLSWWERLRGGARGIRTLGAARACLGGIRPEFGALHSV